MEGWRATSSAPWRSSSLMEVFGGRRLAPVDGGLTMPAQYKKR